MLRAPFFSGPATIYNTTLIAFAAMHGTTDTVTNLFTKGENRAQHGLSRPVPQLHGH